MVRAGHRCSVKLGQSVGSQKAGMRLRVKEIGHRAPAQSADRGPPDTFDNMRGNSSSQRRKHSKDTQCDKDAASVDDAAIVEPLMANAYNPTRRFSSKGIVGH